MPQRGEIRMNTKGLQANNTKVNLNYSYGKIIFTIFC